MKPNFDRLFVVLLVTVVLCLSGCAWSPAPPASDSKLWAQAITFGPAPSGISVGESFSVTATANSGLPVTITSNTPSVCSTTQALAVGTCTLTANQSGNKQYAAAKPVEISFNIGVDSQTISFGSSPSGIAIGMSFAVTATSTSGLPVTQASTTPLVCSITEAIAAGTCTIQGTQAGNATYAAAVPVNLSFNIGDDSQTISFPGMPNTIALATFVPSATASSGLPVVITSTTPSICALAPPRYIVFQALTIGTCTLAANQAGNATYSVAATVTQSFQVTGAPQTITFAAPSPAKTFTLSASASSGLPVTFSTGSTACSVSGNTVTELSSGDCLLQADQAGNNVYAPAPPVTQNVLVGQTITLISITPSSITLAPGETTTFTATAYDQFNNLLATQPSFTWTNANPDGSVTAINTSDTPITVNITASAGSVVSSPAVLTVTTASAVLTTVTISPTASTINAPVGTQKYTTAAFDQFGNPYPVPTCTYTSSNTSAATISTSGIAAAANTGTTVLTTTITAACGSFSPTATLTINPPPYITKITVPAVTVAANSSTQATVSATDENGNPIAITVPITVVAGYNTAVALVTPSPTLGMVSVGGVAVGQTNVTLSVGGASTVMSVTVTACLPVICYAPVLTSITVALETPTMEVNGTQICTASGLDQNGAAFVGATYTWASNNTAVLTVDASGNVTAVGAGSTAVTASSSGVVGTSPAVTVGLLPYPTTPVITSTFPPFAVAKSYATDLPSSPPNSGEGFIPHSTYVVVNGTGFLAGASVCFGSDCTPSQTTFKSSTKLLVAVPWQDLTAAGSVNVTVKNPAMVGYSTVGETSNVTPFTVTTKGFVTITFDDGFTSSLPGTAVFNGQSPSIPTSQFIVTGDDCASRGAAACGGSLLRTDGFPWGCLFISDSNGDPTAPLPPPANGTCPNNNTTTSIGVGTSGYITWADVDYLAAKGNEIAPHTRSHNYLSYLSPSDLINELQGSYNDLLYHATAGVDTAAGYKVSPVTAYPYGDYGCFAADPDFDSCVPGRSTDQQVGTAVKSAGFRGARDSDEGLDGGVKYNEVNCVLDSCWSWSDLPAFIHTVAGGGANCTREKDCSASAGLTCTFLGGTACDNGQTSGGWFDSTQASCPKGTSTAGPGFQCWVDTAVNNGLWVTFLFHRVNENTAPNNVLSVNSTELTKLAAYLKAQAITVVTFGEGLAVEGINGQYETVNSSGQVTVFPNPVD